MTISETHSDYTGYGVSCNGASDGSIDVTVRVEQRLILLYGQMVKLQKMFLT